MSTKEKIVIYDASSIKPILQNDNPYDLYSYIYNLSLIAYGFAYQTNRKFYERDNIFDIVCENIVFHDRNLPKCLRHHPSIIHLCAYYGAYKCLSSIISFSTSFKSLSKIVDSKGKTIAHFAAYSGNVKIFVLLEENCFNLNQKDRKGQTPIYIAVKYNHISLVRYLFVIRNYNRIANNHANNNNNNNNDNNNNNNNNNNNINDDMDDETLAQKLIHVAAEYNTSMPIVNLLFKIAKQVQLFDSDGVSLFSKVIDKSSIEFLQLLLDTFDQCIDSTGLFPLHHAAAISNSPQKVHLLIEYGADTECRSTSNPKKKIRAGETPLITACRHGALKGVISLLDFEADFDAVDENGQTPLHHAAIKGKVDIAEVLIDYGADPEICDNLMMMPVDHAYMKKRGEILALFKEMRIEPCIEIEFESVYKKRNRKNERALEIAKSDGFNYH